MTETHVTVSLPDRQYKLLIHPPACRVPENAAWFGWAGDPAPPLTAFLDELFRHLPVKRCA